MTPQMVNLIDAVRALGLKATDLPSPHCIRIGGHPSTFPDRLAALQRALEEVDATGANALSDGPAAQAPDKIKRLEKALDGLLRFIQIKGVDVEAAADIVSDAMEVEGEKDKCKKYETLPMFSPKKWKKKQWFKPKFNLIPEVPGDVSIDSLRMFTLRHTAALMGSAIAGESAHLSRKVEALKEEAKAIAGPAPI